MSNIMFREETKIMFYDIESALKSKIIVFGSIKNRTYLEYPPKKEKEKK